ncbi:uncharacterized protein LOC128352279 [Hemicordylus capensis]|uniref:uncharacterized protein LOC128352279 n=1 Tax=Hemicordylus capensis TaxID=884348 RepID=UPI0023021725|nr:uncharacterized protein LOC128352279 [Hemicordylus capensis]
MAGGADPAAGIVGPNGEQLSLKELQWLGNFIRTQCMAVVSPLLNQGPPQESSRAPLQPSNSAISASVHKVRSSHRPQRPSFSSSPDSSPARHHIPVGERVWFARRYSQKRLRRNHDASSSSGEGFPRAKKQCAGGVSEAGAPDVNSSLGLPPSNAASMGPVGRGTLEARPNLEPSSTLPSVPTTVRLDGSSSESEREERELSDEQTPSDKPTTARLFSIAEFEILLAKVKRAIKDVSKEDGTQAVQGLDQEVFPSTSSTPAKVPFPSLFREVMLAEWATPVSSKPVFQIPKKLYTLPSDVMDLLAFPVVDAPVAQLVSGSLVNREGEEFLKLPEDKKTDHLLRKIHNGSATVIRAAATNSIFARATILWTKELAKLVPPENLKLRQGLNKIAQASALMADSSLDCLQHASRSMAANVAIRRGLWLKHWRVDAKSKASLGATPFKGSKLFRESLEPVLVETQDKKKAMPGGRTDNRRFFRGGGNGFQNSFRSYRPFTRFNSSGFRDGFRDREFRGGQDRSNWRQSWTFRNRGTGRGRAGGFPANQPKQNRKQ